MELVKRENHWALYNEDGHKIAATIPGCNSKLSIKNCEAIANGYDLDELSENVYREYPTESKNSGFEYNRDRHVFKKRKAFIKGFEKCLELIGDKKFSEEDVKNVYLNSFKHEWFGDCIKSLQQTEWDVEILMGTNYRHIDCVNEGDLVASKIVKDNEAPMLDKNNCLILRRL